MGFPANRYTYALFLDDEEWLLCDNLNDSYQPRNLIRDPSFASVKASLDAELKRWVQRVGDEGLSWQELVKRFDLMELWNERERVLHPSNPRTIGNRCTLNWVKGRFYLPLHRYHFLQRESKVLTLIGLFAFELND